MEEAVPFVEPVAVIVTFLEEQPFPPKINLDHFSFSQAREFLKEVNSSFSEALIEERRENQ